MTAEGSTHPGPAQEATELGRYRLHDPVRGPLASGDAFRATDTRSQSAVVVTMFAGDDRKHFLADVERLREARHRALPQVLDSGVADGTAWLATAPIGGPPLTEMLGPSGQMAPTLAVRLIGEIADALERLHRVGLVHGQLSPEAILVRQHPVERPVLGMLQLGGGDLSSPVAPAYRAPEVSSGGPVTQASDHYSLSLVLLEVLTGGRDNGMPPGLESVFEAALATDPSRRTSSHELVSETARALMSGQVPTTTLEPAPEPEPPPERPEPAPPPAAATPAEPRPASRAPERETPQKRTRGLLGALGLSVARPGVKPEAPETPQAAAPPVKPEERQAPREEAPASAQETHQRADEFPGAEMPAAPPAEPAPPPSPPPPPPPAAQPDPPPSPPVAPHPEPPRPAPAPEPEATEHEEVPPSPPPGRPARRGRRVGAVVLGLLLVAAFGAAGFLLGSRAGEAPAPAGTQRAEAGDVALEVPSGWERGDEPPRGLPTADPVSARARRGSLNVGTVKGDGPLFPAQTARRIIPDPQPDGSVRLGDLTAYRFTGDRSTLFLAPTTAGLVAVSCTGDRGFLPACQRAAATLRLDGDARPVALSGLGAYAARADRVIDRLAVTRRRDRRTLRRARTRGGQARTARRIARADRRAARQLGRGVPPAARRQVTSLRRSLNRAASAYTVLARAKTRRGYSLSSRQVRAAERQINRALARL